MIRFKCPHCSMDVEVDNSFAGQSGPCPGCGQTLTIPGAAAAPQASMTGAGMVPPPTQGPSGQPVPAPEKTSRWAIASLVCGLLGCLVIPAIPGIILGILGIREVNRSEGRVGGMGLSIAGLIVSVVMLLGMGGMLGLQALVGGNFSSSLEQARRAQCAANLRSIGQSIKVYAAGNRGKWPTVYSGRDGEAWRQDWGEVDTEIADAQEGKDQENLDPYTCNLSCWWVLVRKGMSTPGVFVCPSSMQEPSDVADPGKYWGFESLDQCSYSYQNQLGKGTTDNADAAMIVAADVSPLRGDVADEPSTRREDRDKERWELNSPNHDFEGQNVLYADGHVQFDATPDVGVANNNIWLRSVYDNSTQTWSEDETGYDDPRSQIGYKKDSFLVP